MKIVIDEYIDKFDKYNESLFVKNNNDMLELKIIVFVLVIVLVLFKVIWRVKRLQEN